MRHYSGVAWRGEPLSHTNTITGLIITPPLSGLTHADHHAKKPDYKQQKAVHLHPHPVFTAFWRVDGLDALVMW